MLSRTLDRPLWEPLHRDLDRTRDGIGGGDGNALVLSAPDGAYAGAPAIVTGGTPIVYMVGEYAPITAGDGEIITPYMFIINGVETGEWFESPTTFPFSLAESDEVKVKDSLGRMSNPLIGEWIPGILDYFSRSEALDSLAFDLTAIDEYYTPTYSKAGFNELQSSMVASGYWGQCSEIWTLSGVRYGAVTAKLKFSSNPVTSISNSTSANYAPAGSFPGFMGNTTNREINTNWGPSSTLTIPNAHHGTFITQAPTGGDFRFQGSYNGNGQLLSAYIPDNAGVIKSEAFSTPTNVAQVSSSALGCLLFSINSTSHRIVKDGSLIATGSAPSGGLMPSANYMIGSGGGFYYSDARQAIAFSGSNLSSGQESSLNASVQKFLRHFGYNMGVGFLGDSNSAGSTIGPSNAPPQKTRESAAQRRVVVKVTNGAISGTTSAFWATNIAGFVSDMASQNVKRVLICIGTNNAKTSVATSKASYKSDMITITSALVAAGMTPILNFMPYPTPGALGEWDSSSPSLVEGYNEALVEIADGTTILLGDQTAYAYTRDNPSTMSDGIHLTVAAAAEVGLRWSRFL